MCACEHVCGPMRDAMFSINKLLADANRQLRALQATTPRPVKQQGQSGIETYVVRRGKVITGKAAMAEKAKYVAGLGSVGCVYPQIGTMP